MQMEEEGQYIYAAEIPTNTTKNHYLRACLICGLIKEPKQFQESGCENCNVLNIEKGDFLESCTTTQFEGMLAIMQPQTSWVAKWQRTSTRLPGCYATVVHGRISMDVVNLLHDHGLEYHPLDDV